MQIIKFCRLRQDLINKELGAPVGNTFYNSTKPVQYWWVDDVDFKVLINGNWEDAHSIDFDFELETLTIHDLRGTFELKNSKMEIVKDNLEDREACETWAIENGYNDFFNEPIEPIDPIEQAKQVLIKAGYFGITWTLSDIIERAKSDGYLIDETQARGIAEEIEDRHDCEIGINWDNVSFHIGEFARENDFPELEFVEFEGKEYPTREIDLEEEGISKIATLALEEALRPTREIQDSEAQDIDDTIFFYVDENQINLPESELVALIKESL